ncbi:ester cyclase [Amycolatopsis anabasis]|uniref:ester cyclase n=1 Tax=Amycolatopsis anabasis TaxID=1840409 RepID=UPI00131B0786|nr:ester cyclase [Amycolatopsis anabasis]
MDYAVKVREFAERAWSVTDPGALDTVGELATPDAVFYVGSRPKVRALSEFQDLVRVIKRGQPDLRYEFLDLITQGTTVAARLRFTGTHLGHLAGFVPPTGKLLSLTEMIVVRMNDQGLLTELWQESDFHGLLIRAGAIPAPGTGPFGHLTHAVRTLARDLRRHP